MIINFSDENANLSKEKKSIFLAGLLLEILNLHYHGVKMLVIY